MPANLLPTDSMEQVEFSAGEVLFEQDQKATHLFVVRSGTIRLMRRVFRESFVAEELGKGAVCGEVALAPRALYPTRAVAVEDTVVMAIPAEQFDAAMQKEPAIASLIARKMAARLTYTHYRLGSFALRSIEGRILLQLRSEAMRAGGLTGAVWVAVPWDLPQALNLEDARARSVTESLVAQGLIEVDGSGRFRVVDLSSLDRRLAYLELHDRFEAG